MLTGTQDEITITMRCAAATVSIIVPPGWRVDDQVLVLGRRRAIDARDDGAGFPLLRLRGVVLGGTFQLSES